MTSRPARPPRERLLVYVAISQSFQFTAFSISQCKIPGPRGRNDSSTEPFHYPFNLLYFLSFSVNSQDCNRKREAHKI